MLALAEANRRDRCRFSRSVHIKEKTANRATKKTVVLQSSGLRDLARNPGVGAANQQVKTNEQSVEAGADVFNPVSRSTPSARIQSAITLVFR